MTSPLMDDHYIKSYLGADTANYRDRCVAFVDILGFRDLIARIESPDDALFQRLYCILATIRELRNNKLSGVQVSCFSDCIVISSTPDSYFSIILRVRDIYEALLFHGILCRGAVMKGWVSNIVFGTMGSERIVRKFDLTEDGKKYFSMEHSFFSGQYLKLKLEKNL